MPGLGSFLIAIPEVVVMRISERDAELEIRGAGALAFLGDAGICIGIRARLPERRLPWLRRVTHLVAASDAMLDFSIALESERWVLWRAYGAIPAACDEQTIDWMSASLGQQLSLSRYLTSLGRISTSALAPIGRFL